MGLRERLLVSKSDQRIELCIQCNTPSLGRLILARTGRVRGRSGKTGSLCHHFLGTSRSSHNKISSQRARALEAFGVHGPRKPDGSAKNSKDGEHVLEVCEKKEVAGECA